jgi:peptide/nickel transport system substrate-binding protein
VNQSEPRLRGTLRLYGPGEITRLDPSCYHPATASSQVNRLFARQLFSYRPETDLRSWQAIAPVPDLAVAIPSIYNAGLGASGTSYVVHLRTDVYWDTTPPRRLVADDVIRGLKRMCNPVLRSPMLAYFLSTVRGFQEFCDGYGADVRNSNPDPEQLARYQNSHEIPGVFALDDQTLIFELVRPALAFVNILALPCASPAPVEYDALVPNSPEFHASIRSIGPYRPVEVSSTRLLFEPNRVWRQESDPIRRQHLDGLEIVKGSADGNDVANRIDAGAADLPWGLRVAPDNEDLPGDPDSGLGYSLDPYVVFNMASPRADGALSKREIRRAIAHAIDKEAIVALVNEISSGWAARAADSIIPIGNEGYKDAGPGYRLDLAQARTLLAEAGYPDGLALTAVCPVLPPYLQITHSYVADLAKIGISVSISELAVEDYYALLEHPRRTQQGAWDLACLSWWPSWFHRNGQTFLQPLFQANSWRGTANCGQFQDAQAYKLIESALDTVDPHQADMLWRAVEQEVVDACVIVPLLFQTPVRGPRRSQRVRNVIPLPALGHAVDLANVRLDDTA